MLRNDFCEPNIKWSFIYIAINHKDLLLHPHYEILNDNDVQKSSEAFNKNKEIILQ